MNTIGIVGNGFVGGSMTTVFSERGLNVYTFDKAGKKAPGSNPRQFLSIDHLVEVCEQDGSFTSVIFVCLPSPMLPSGECDTSIIEEALNDLARRPGHRIAVVKSTVPPGTCSRWNKMFGKTLSILHSPEFLSERTALIDMRTQNRIVIGGEEPSRSKVKAVFVQAFPDVPILETTSDTSEMVKYFTNVHLAARIVLSCEFHQLCEKLTNNGISIKYDDMARIASYDERLGGSHMDVPGRNNIPGARGHCLPKDLSAMAYVCEKLGIAKCLMKAIKEKNLQVVPLEHRDWEKMIGRGVSEKGKPNLVQRVVRGAISTARETIEKTWSL
jgi:UDPglucose 6-dehydrogenase